jgi:hypothetical protein
MADQMIAWNRLTPALVLLAMACADFSSPSDPTGGAPDILVANPSFANDIQPIFTARCSIGGCHSLASAQGQLILTADASYDNLVDVISTQNELFRRVRPLKPDSSWLYRLITPDPAGRAGYPRMPLSSVPLTANQIGTIANWITQGAPRN